MWIVYRSITNESAIQLRRNGMEKKSRYIQAYWWTCHYITITHIQYVLNFFQRYTPSRLWFIVVLAGWSCARERAQIQYFEIKSKLLNVIKSVSIWSFTFHILIIGHRYIVNVSIQTDNVPHIFLGPHTMCSIAWWLVKVVCITKRYNVC
jgi:hypothetical protein